MTKPVTVHIGLAKTGSTTLQSQYLSQAPEITYLGKNAEDEAVNKACRNIARQKTELFSADANRPIIEAKINASSGVPVLSDEDFSVWKFFHPRELGRRLGDTLPFPRLIFVTRKPTTWVLSQYYFRLMTYRRDTFIGPNYWLEKHLSQLKVGSDLAEIQFAYTLDIFRQAADATEWLILPYEMLRQDEADFLGRIEDFIGVPGALTRIHQSGVAEAKKTRPTETQANYVRALSFYKKEPERLLELAQVIKKIGGGGAKKQFREIKNNPDASLDDWVKFFRLAQRNVFTALREGDREISEALDLFHDYEIREGLLAHVADVEAEETERMMETFGVDLRPWGYGPAAA